MTAMSVRSAVVIGQVRAGELSIAQAAAQLGCHAGSLERRVWNETKADVIARDVRCLVCGSARHLDVHHRRARGMGGTADPVIAFGMANLVTLCRGCHRTVEAQPNSARRRHLRLDAGQDPAATPVRSLRGWLKLSADGGADLVDGGEAA